MKRRSIAPRADWAAIAEAQGFLFHTPDGVPYWDESACYELTLDQVERHLETAAGELHAICLDLVDHAVRDERLLSVLGVPPAFHNYVAESWRRRDPTLYGRFDLAYDGTSPPKLLEYNADTPTALFEAAVFQWGWLEQRREAGALPSGVDQFNSLHDKLVATLDGLRRQVSQAGLGEVPSLHLTCASGSDEDRGTIAYLEDCARLAGFRPVALPIEAIGLRSDRRFVDLDGAIIERLFKLYPWEWLFAEPFGASLPTARLGVLEPPWKAILSTKGLLPLLWQRHPGHPNLLPAAFDDAADAASVGPDHVVKPLLSREGANIDVVREGQPRVSSDGPYRTGRRVRQALAHLPRFEGRVPIVGAWVVGEQAAGIGIREGDGPITTDRSRFVPHVILG